MKPRKAAVVFIFVTVALDMLALGLIAPVLPKLVLNFLGGDTTSAAKWFGIFGTVFALMQFVFSPVLGVLSDRLGAVLGVALPCAFVMRRRIAGGACLL